MIQNNLMLLTRYTANEVTECDIETDSFDFATKQLAADHNLTKICSAF